MSDHTSEPIDRATLTVDGACRAAGVSRRTLYNWMAKDKIEYVRTAGGSPRIFVDTLWRTSTPAPSEQP